MTVVTLQPWGPQHLHLLVEANTPEMTQHLGGPESEQALLRRHERYLASGADGGARMFAIGADGEHAGGIGFWPIEHDGEAAFETGWNVLPRWQGHGIAGEALRALIALAAQHAAGRGRLFAYPSAGNVASNALCRRAGFADVGAREFPFRGTVLHTRVWALDLRDLPAARASIPG